MRLQARVSSQPLILSISHLSISLCIHLSLHSPPLTFPRLITRQLWHHGGVKNLSGMFMILSCLSPSSFPSTFHLLHIHSTLSPRLPPLLPPPHLSLTRQFSSTSRVDHDPILSLSICNVPSFPRSFCPQIMKHASTPSRPTLNFLPHLSPHFSPAIFRRQ